MTRGAAILGTGGGGDPYLGGLAALKALEEYGAPIVIDAHELSDRDLVACPVLVGAPVPLVEKFSFGPEVESVHRALERSLDRPISAVMSPEIGGVNTVLALTLGARLGIPVVDADGTGRAYPEVDLVTFTLFGISASPFALADEHGNSAVIEGIDNRWVERIARAVVVEFGSICAGMGYSMTGEQVREAAILGSLSKIETIGRAIREAQDRKADPVDEIVQITHGFILFRGKIADVDRRTMQGWTIGDALIEGVDEFVGSTMRISFQNENLVAFRDDALVACVPDLIQILDADHGEAIVTERLRYGFRVIVIGMPCDDKWRTEAGVALGGPRRFRYDFDYTPIESLQRPRQQTRSVANSGASPFSTGGKQ